MYFCVPTHGSSKNVSLNIKMQLILSLHKDFIISALCIEWQDPIENGPVPFGVPKDTKSIEIIELGGQISVTYYKMG